MPDRPLALPNIVWVRIDCIRYHDRGPYHWTRKCLEGRAFLPIDHARATQMSNRRPCKLCTTRQRHRRDETPTEPARAG